MEDLSEVISVYGELPVFSPDGSHLAYVSTDGSIRLISLINEEEPKVFRGNINKVSSIAFSVDGTLLFSGDYNNDWSNPDREGKLKVWSISDETLLLELSQYNSISLRVSPDGTFLYVHDGDGIISVWGHRSISCKIKSGLTKRAPDAGDSAAISSSFLRLSIFLVGRLRRPRPSAGNANRWAVPCKD